MTPTTTARLRRWLRSDQANSIDISSGLKAWYISGGGTAKRPACHSFGATLETAVRRFLKKCEAL